jgi:hypothetical protein
MNRNDREVLTVVFIIMGIAMLIGLVIAIFFYLTLMRCLQRIQERNREMEPWQVWLNFIPCFGMVWIFFTVIKIANSLQKEYRSRRWPLEGEGFGNGVGIAFAALSIAGMIPYIGALFSIASLVCFIIYWVQIAGYSAKLAADPYDPSRRDDYDDQLDRDYERRRLPRSEPREGPADERIRSEKPPDDYPPDERIRSGEE